MSSPSVTHPKESVQTPVNASVSDERMHQIMRRQRWQDFLFHKITLSFAALVLVVETAKCAIRGGRSPRVPVLATAAPVAKGGR